MEAKERPILFSAPMVRALLAGTKTQTRRVVKPQPRADTTRFLTGLEQDFLTHWPVNGGDYTGGGIACPYGQPGDRLWVREAFSGLHEYEEQKWPPGAWFHDDPIWYWADGNPDAGDWTRPKPSIHMPRWASRITLEITDVRVQRLQEISYEDAIAEGINDPANVPPFPWPSEETPEQYARRTHSPQIKFANLWDDINGAGGWDANPWVWAVSFKRVTP